MNDANYVYLTTGEGTTEKISDFQVGIELFTTSFNRRQVTMTFIIHPRVHSTPFHLSSVTKKWSWLRTLRSKFQYRAPNDSSLVHSQIKSDHNDKQGVVQYTRRMSNLSLAEVDLWETREKR